MSIAKDLLQKLESIQKSEASFDNWNTLKCDNASYFLSDSKSIHEDSSKKLFDIFKEKLSKTPFYIVESIQPGFNDNEEELAEYETQFRKMFSNFEKSGEVLLDDKADKVTWNDEKNLMTHSSKSNKSYSIYTYDKSLFPVEDDMYNMYGE